MSTAFWNRVAKSNECWIWTGPTDPRGYGRVAKGRLAHRVAYQLAVGDIPPGLELDHLCRNPTCVRPDHLEPVTHAENVRRGMAGKTNNHNHRITHCPSGHPYEGDNLVFSPPTSTWRKCRECMRAQTRRWRASR